ncbi:MAG: hypothetical protein ABIR33_06300 [Pyrinomonadaceae bacterium]
MDRNRPRIVAGFCFTVLLSVGLFVFDADGQINRRRTKSTPTPVPVRTGEPAVISRADDYPTVVIEPAPVNTDPSVPASSDVTIEELRERLLQLESKSRIKDPEQKQRQLAMNLDILTKSEQRSDGLRKQLFEMIEKENSVRGRIDQIDNDIRPEAINSAMATVGSLRPEELREQRRRSLALEKTNLQVLLTEVQKNRTNLELNVQRADALVEKLRVKIEKEIDAALMDDEGPGANKPID